MAQTSLPSFILLGLHAGPKISPSEIDHVIKYFKTTDNKKTSGKDDIIAKILQGK